MMTAEPSAKKNIELQLTAMKKKNTVKIEKE